jgi:hypothetical protein
VHGCGPQCQYGSIFSSFWWRRSNVFSQSLFGSLVPFWGFIVLLQTFMPYLELKPHIWKQTKIQYGGGKVGMGLDVKQMGFHQTWIKIVLQCIDYIYIYIYIIFLFINLINPKNHSQNYIDASIKPKKKKKIGTKFGK